MPGTATSTAEVTNISPHGVWMLIDEREHFLPFEEFPWFKRAPVEAILRIERRTPRHLHWPELDVDLTLDSIDTLSDTRSHQEADRAGHEGERYGSRVSEDDRRAELLRQFEAVIARAELDDLRGLVGDLSRLGAQARNERSRSRRPELRRAQLPGLQLFRVRVDLRHAAPPIWRRLELRSDLTLDVVHRVLQAAFGWTDSHLWRFCGRW